LQTLFYYKVIYSLKKVLWSFHKKLRPVIVFVEATSATSEKCALYIRDYEPNKVFY